MTFRHYLSLYIQNRQLRNCSLLKTSYEKIHRDETLKWDRRIDKPYFESTFSDTKKSSYYKIL